MNESINSSATEPVPAPLETAEAIAASLESAEAAPSTIVAPPEIEVPPPLPIRARPVPVQDAERHVTLDVVRGVALCGILLVNIENFAMVREARYDPALGGGASRLDHAIWLGTYLFADTKFIAIFTMLFGAGIAAANERRAKRQTDRPRWRDYRTLVFLPIAALVFLEYYRTEHIVYFKAYCVLWAVWVLFVPRPEAIHYRRVLFLAAVGAAHGLYLWRGDILYFYAFWGLALYFAPRFPAPLLGVAGLVTYAYFLQQFSEQLLDASGGYSWWERVIYRGHWWDQYRYRLESEDFYLRVLPMEFSTHLVGLMLCGMALYKSGFLTGRGPAWAYAALAVITLAAGGYLVADGTALTTNFAGLFEAKEFVWGSLLLSIGYVNATIALTNVIGPRWGLGGFAALGRMAFTNYLMQSVVCTTIFYGYGFGLFERTSRTEQLGILTALLVFQMAFSKLWLRFFRFGPLEWIWRSFSYWRPQPILRERAPEAAIAA